MLTGKLPGELLKELLQDTSTNENVIAGPKIGLDAAKIKTCGKNLVVGSDPITFTAENIGKYCVYINANDIAVSGAIPKYFMATILLPPKINEQEAKEIFNQVNSTCKEMNIALIGGHTEITDSVTRPIISGTMFGEEFINLIPANAKIGADIILVNKPAIEGTSILAFNGKDKLLKSGISQEKIDFALNLLNTQGICILSVVKELLKYKDSIYYMHDPTEGGIASALTEMSIAINKGIKIDEIEFMDETKEFCQILKLDPFGLISSGTLIAVTDNGNYIVNKLTNKGFYAKVIGKVTDEIPKVIYKGEKIKTFSRDEIARYFEEN